MEDYCDYIYIVLRNFIEQVRRRFTFRTDKHCSWAKTLFFLFRKKKAIFSNQSKKNYATIKDASENAGADYLAHAIIDNIVDNYFIVLENLEEKIEFLEDDLVRQTNTATLQKIHELKRELILLRKSLWPLEKL